jgi:D-alanyl-D-alanine carboxypeptidase
MPSSRRWTPSSRTAAAAVVLAIAAAPGPTKAERRLVADLDRIFNAPIMEQGVWGVEIKSLDSGRVLYARNPRTLMMPA